MEPGNTYSNQKSKHNKELYQKLPRKLVKQYKDLHKISFTITLDADRKTNTMVRLILLTLTSPNESKLKVASCM